MYISVIYKKILKVFANNILIKLREIYNLMNSTTFLIILFYFMC